MTATTSYKDGDTHLLDPQQCWETAQRVLPGGVNAAARVNRALGRPFLAHRGYGALIVDQYGHEYIDLHMSAGASLLGHGHPSVCKAVEQATDLGFICGHETIHQIALAQALVAHIPGAELVRFGNSGTEMTWHAIRLARAYTGKSVVVKFEGHFHGYHDYLGYSAWPQIVLAGPASAPVACPESAGMPPELARHVVVLPFNDPEALSTLLERRHHEIAAVILEPVNYNGGTIVALPGYLEAVRSLTAQYECLLIFDEILSGFRTGLGCVQGYMGVTPDLTTLGKALGGGMVLSALAGKREIMQYLAPQGPVMHSGIFNAHLIPILAARAFLDIAAEANFYPTLLDRCDRLYRGLRHIFRAAGIKVKVQALGARFSLLFGLQEEDCVTCYRDVALIDQHLATTFYRLALEEGLYFHPGWHHGLSSSHTDAHIDEVLRIVERIAAQLRRANQALCYHQ